MGQEEDKINDLEKRYRELWDRHQALKEEIRTNFAEFKAWKEGKTPGSEPVRMDHSEDQQIHESTHESQRKTIKPERQLIDWEHFVGEKLLARIGIAVVLIGVAIGVKYAIDHQLIGAGLRLLGGYLVGAILGFLAYRLHRKLNAFSAVLASGALAIAYFMTYAGYAFYHIFPLWLAYGGMLLTVVITVLAALWMNRVIIAHLGLLGAYLLPPLVSTGNQHITYYLGYLLLINVGILVLTFLRSWKSLFVPVSIWSLAIFTFWFLDDYTVQDTWLATGYIWLFFGVVSLGIRARKLRFNEVLAPWDQVHAFLVIAVTFLGLNACGHSSDFQALVAGSVPIALSVLFWFKDRSVDGEEARNSRDLQLWLTIVAASMLPFPVYYPHFVLLLSCSVLMWYAMNTQLELLRILATIATGVSGLVVISAAFARTFGDHHESPWINDFVMGLFVVLLFHLLIFRVNRGQFLSEKNRVLLQFNTVIVVAISALSGFAIIRYAGNVSLSQLKSAGEPITIFTNLDRLDPNKSKAYLMLGYAWIGFVLATTVWYRKRVLRMSSVFRDVIQIAFLLTLAVTMAGVSNLNAWSDDFAAGELDRFLFEGARYGFFIALVVIGWLQWKKQETPVWEMAAVHVGILWLLSLELIHWSLIYEIGVGYKLLLSLLWGTYAVFLLIHGLKNGVSALRITAFAVLGIMLLKLFFYDLTMLSTITKTLVFLLIGGLLLVGGYFYQRLSKQLEE